jgi:acyl-coenzyme A thioesterase PaaI-like protein
MTTRFPQPVGVDLPGAQRRAGAAPAPAPAPAGRRAALQGWWFRQVLNFWPCMRGTGGRLARLSADFTQATVRLPCNWRTRNKVGTIFGGSMAAATDPMYMLMLHKLLGPDFVVWDKGFAIRFRRPARRDLQAHFHVTPERLAEVREAVRSRGEADFTWPVELVDDDGVVHAEIDRTLYVADKAFYHAKQAARVARSTAGGTA